MSNRIGLPLASQQLQNRILSNCHTVDVEFLQVIALTGVACAAGLLVMAIVAVVGAQ
jgi:hypothetical protein